MLFLADISYARLEEAFDIAEGYDVPDVDKLPEGWEDPEDIDVNDFYDIVENNCATLFLNICHELDIDVDDRVMDYASARLSQYEKIYELIMDSPNNHKVLGNGGKDEDLVANLVHYYVETHAAKGRA